VRKLTVQHCWLDQLMRERTGFLPLYE